MRDFNHIIDAVQANCDIADAHHARDTTLCNYLMGMRELYRWEQELPLAQALPKQEVSAWLAQREARWNELDDTDFRSIPIAGREYAPFDSAAINAALVPQGYVYGGGYGRWGKPTFFLGELVRSERRAHLGVLVAGCEYARGVLAPPAALNNGTVYLRMDAMQRWLWERYEIWGVHKVDDALKAALDCYGEHRVEAKLAHMAEHESETLILHERGEARAEPLLGQGWRDMLASFADRRAELVARAVRDHLADCLVTLPELLEGGDGCSIHFYFANFDGLRRQLFPRLVQGYHAWRATDDDDGLRAAVAAGGAHWQDAAQGFVAAWRSAPPEAERTIAGFVEKPGALLL